jgi:hypothetical protein
LALALGGVVLVVVVLLVVAQLVLPGIAAHQIRSRLTPYGSVRSVDVHAFPAIKLLWHHADRVDVALASYRSGSGEVGSQLGDAGSVGTLNLSAATVDIGLLRLRNASLTKRGSSLRAAASVSESDVRAAVPFLQDVTPVASSGGALTLRGTVSALGFGITADATVGVSGGTLVVTPDVPLGGLGTVTLFSDPHVAVDAVGASTTAGGFRVMADGELR